MKLYHFILVFVLIAISLIIILDIKTNDLNTVINNKKQIEKNLDTAIDDGVSKLVQVDTNNNIIVNKDAAIESFFMSLDSTFGILEDLENREKLNLYIPVVTVTMEDGYYIFYSDEYKEADGNTYVSKRWSEKFHYVYEDNDFIYGFTLGDVVTLYDKNKLLDITGEQSVFQLDYHDLKVNDEYASFRIARPDSILLSDEAFVSIRKATLINCMEKSMAYYTSRHNHIAEQEGITYNFSLPAIREEEWEPYLDTNSMFVVFQGYPYGDKTGETYNRVASAGAKVSKRSVYYLEQKGWYLLYHVSKCPELQKEGIIFGEEPYYKVETCVATGAYACPVCIKDNGVYAPDYTPIVN
jgi:hypothetical protein